MERLPIIPVSEPLIGKLEEETVLECIRSGWISSEGQFVKKFEEACAKTCTVTHGIAVSSGTAALQVALQTLDLKAEDEVILPTFTIISCALAVLEAGAKPVLVDSDPDTWTMDVSQVEEKITSRTKAIMPVHIYGHPVDMDPILSLAKKYDLYVIEDCAEAHGAEYKGKRCGCMGDISILSFYANKLVTAGEGGMVLTNNDGFAEKARSLRNLCFKSEKRFYHTEIGHSYRMSNLQAALGFAQCARLDEFITRKRAMAKRYTEQLRDLPIKLPVEKEWAKNIYWMYALVLDDSVSFDAFELAQRFQHKQIQTRPFFIGMHEQPVFNNRGLFTNESYPISERIAKRGLYLPSGQAITAKQIDTVCEALHVIL
jgi:perosamine synthetase